MSIVKRIIKNNIEFVKVDELLAKEYEQAGYGGPTKRNASIQNLAD